MNKKNHESSDPATNKRASPMTQHLESDSSGEDAQAKNKKNSEIIDPATY